MVMILDFCCVIFTRMNRAPIMRLTVLLAFCSFATLGQDQLQRPRAEMLFKPAQGQSFYLDLDTAEGKYSEWRHEDVTRLCALRASVRIIRLRTDVRWTPTFSIWFAERGKGKQAKQLGLQFLTKYRTPPLETRLILEDSPTSHLEHALKTNVKLNQAVPVEIAWLDHSILINVDQESVRLPLPWEIGNITVSSSTGEMKLEPLILGCVDQ
jgi:hypothetical protein